MDTLADKGLEKETRDLDAFYHEVQAKVHGITDPAAKQKVIAELYERFFRLAAPEAARSLGIVYTPVEVVDWIIRSVEDSLNRDFGVSFSSEGVNVFDPFTGTGTFIQRLIASGLIKREDLRRKYDKELYANEINLLAYYIAAINIESTYHAVTGAEDYEPFNGIVWTDTFQDAETTPPTLDDSMFSANSGRSARQRERDMMVVMGNPPWSRTANRSYPVIDERVKNTYAKISTANSINSLYDPYVKAIRLASDKVQESDRGGVVAFVTNGGFIDSKAFDGFRKVVADEFDAIYCYNLRRRRSEFR